MPGLTRALPRLWAGQRLATRILLTFLPLLLVALLFMGALGVGSMAGLGEFAVDVTNSLGSSAISDSRTALTQQARDALHQLAIDNALLGEAEFGQVDAAAEALARYATSVWSVPSPPVTPSTPLQARSASYMLAPGVEPEAVAPDLTRAAQIQPLLVALGEGASMLTAVFLGTESGVMQVFPSTEGLPADFDPRTRPWYRAAMQANGVVWTDPYVDLAGKGLVLTAARQVLDAEGRAVGVVGIDIANAAMTRRLAEAGLSGQGYAFAVDRHGHVIIAPELDETDTPADQAFVTEDLLASPEPDVRLLAARMTQGLSGVSQVTFADGVRYVGYAPLRTNGWSIAVVARVEDIIAPAARIDALIASQVGTTRDVMERRLDRVKTEFAVVLVLVLLIAAGVTVALSQTITRRLQRLEGAAIALERGDLADHEVNELGASEEKDEVSSLMRVFARMAARVREREQALRQEVQELHIEIDRTKAAEQVAEITETDYFQDLQAKARAMRASKSPPSE
jgi:phosphoserine phosphatase RsbU/P